MNFASILGATDRVYYRSCVISGEFLVNHSTKCLFYRSFQRWRGLVLFHSLLCQNLRAKFRSLIIM